MAILTAVYTQDGLYHKHRSFEPCFKSYAPFLFGKF